AFYLEELPGGSANANIHLLIRTDMANFEARISRVSTAQRPNPGAMST
ncbi:hypothetical protein A2U01_0085026, partial [Trifolium medium]|nr:hypothetical protein [Trifolium medium]